jgi:hypothetical protein
MSLCLGKEKAGDSINHNRSFVDGWLRFALCICPPHVIPAPSPCNRPRSGALATARHRSPPSLRRPPLPRLPPRPGRRRPESAAPVPRRPKGRLRKLRLSPQPCWPRFRCDSAVAPSPRSPQPPLGPRVSSSFALPLVLGRARVRVVAG